jgi:hypothetical protein
MTPLPAAAAEPVRCTSKRQISTTAADRSEIVHCSADSAAALAALSQLMNGK